MECQPPLCVNLLHLLAASDSATALSAVEQLLISGRHRVDELEDQEMTALHVAAAWDNLAMCQLLIYHGADPYQPDQNGRTARDMAKGSAKRFFDRVYDASSPGRSRDLRKRFTKALHQLFSCSKLRNGCISTIRRPHSWSPEYRRKEILSSEERKLRHAFRKNQPKPFLTPTINQSRMLEQGHASESTFSGKSSNTLHSLHNCAVRCPNGKAQTMDGSEETFVTANECKRSSIKSSNSSFDPMSEIMSGLGCLGIEDEQKISGCWMTENSSDENVSKEMQIPIAVIQSIQQLNDQQLKREFAKRGEAIGPLCESTRSAYEIKLARLLTQIPPPEDRTRCSWALETWMNGHKFLESENLDQMLTQGFIDFSNNHCREGKRPTSFCYILIDPSMIDFPSTCTLRQFVNAIFYIGKGKRSRPLQHIIEALKAKKLGESFLSKSGKLHRIADLWRKGFGVVSLHVFQNIIPAEAFTREAAMIDAIGLINLTNMKRGDYYGVAKQWSMKEKTIYGSFLLANALEIFRIEGCRQIYETDISYN